MRLKPVFTEAELLSWINRSGSRYDGVLIMAPIELTQRLNIYRDGVVIACNSTFTPLIWKHYAMGTAKETQGWIDVVSTIRIDHPITIDDAEMIRASQSAVNSLYNSTRTENSEQHWAIEVFSKKAYFVNFHLRGGDKQLTDKWYIDGLQSGIRFNNPYGEYHITQDSLIYGFNWGAVWHFDAKKVTIDDGTQLIGANCPYFNYGAWGFGRGNAVGQELHMHGCVVDAVRHAIGASGHPNDYFATGNVIINTIKHAFDRHAVDGYGGRITYIAKNKILNPDRYAFSIHPPAYGGSFTFKHNELNRVIDKPLGQITNDIINDGYPYRVTDDIGNVIIDISSNTFGV